MAEPADVDTVTIWHPVTGLSAVVPRSALPFHYRAGWADTPPAEPAEPAKPARAARPGKSEENK